MTSTPTPMSRYNSDIAWTRHPPDEKHVVEKHTAIIKTEKRTYFPSGQVTTEAGIDTGLFKDFYVSLGDNFKEDSWSFRLQSKPFIRWIWLGALLITLGTFISGFNLMRKQT